MVNVLAPDIEYPSQVPSTPYILTNIFLDIPEVNAGPYSETICNLHQGQLLSNNEGCSLTGFAEFGG